MLTLKRGLPFNPRMVKATSADSGEEGYILLAVLFLVVMVLIALSVAAPKVAADIQRDREIELQHRGMQYRRAIQLYYRKFQAYPPNMEALEKANNIRFLRKRYKDPATGKDEWKLIHFGENKTPTAIGFFGQPIAGSTLAGTGPGGVGQNLGTAMNSAFGSNGSNGGGTSTFGASPGSGFGNSPGGGSSFGGSGSSFGSSSFGSSSPTGTTPTDPNSGSAGGIGSSSPTGGTGGGAGTTGTDTGSTSGTSSSSSTFGGNGQTFGGGGIIGVESMSAKATILEYKKKKHFNEWEFTYDPASERQTVSSNVGIGQPVGGTGNGNSSFSNAPGASQGISGTPLPGNPGGGTPIDPSQPQQNPQQ